MIELDEQYIKTRSVLEPSTGCWNWCLYKDRNGYGVLNRGPKKLFAHRVSFKIHHHDPEDLFVCHKCDNPACVNPDHLFAGTPNDNVQDMMNKNRHRAISRAGEINPNSKLTEEVVLAIYEYEGSQVSIGKRFGISQRTVSRIKRKETWSTILGAQDG